MHIQSKRGGAPIKDAHAFPSRPKERAMLSHHDRRRLEAIEQQLRHEDAEFMLRLTRWPSSPARLWARRTAIGLIILSVLGALFGLMLFSPALLVLSVATALGSWAWLSRPNPPHPR
jgi:hypothetical protein